MPKNKDVDPNELICLKCGRTDTNPENTLHCPYDDRHPSWGTCQIYFQDELDEKNKPKFS